MSRFSHPSFASRAWYQQTVCIVCQRWFCKIKNTDRKSRFYNTFEKPECYFLWLGDRADTPEAQAEFLAAPYQGEGGLTNGWQRKKNASCEPCGEARLTPDAQEKHKKTNKCTDPFGKGCTNKVTGSKRPCPDCQEKKKGAAAAPSS